MSVAHNSRMKFRLRHIAAAIVVAASSIAAAAPAAGAPVTASSKASPAQPPATVTFAGETYSYTPGRPGSGEYKYTAKAQPGPADQHDTLEIMLFGEFGARHTTGDFAYRVIAGIHDLGILVSTHPMGEDASGQTEYLVVTNAPNTGSREIAYTRILTVKGILAVVTYTHRVVGEQATTEAAGWLEDNGTRIEQTMEDWADWDGMPSTPMLGPPPSQ